MTPKLSKHKISKLTQKLSQNKKISIKETKENKSCSTTLVHPKTVFGPYPNAKNSPLGPQKSKTTPKLSQNKKPELEEL